MPDLDDILRPKPAVTAQETPDGAIIVDMVTGRCWELNLVGAALWSQLASASSLREIIGSIQRKYSAPAEVVERDVLALVDRLMSAGLVERTTALPVR